MSDNALKVPVSYNYHWIRHNIQTLTLPYITIGNGQCVVSCVNLACAGLTRHKTLSASKVKLNIHLLP